MSKKKAKKKRSEPRTPVATEFSAPTADRHHLYELSVQDSEGTISLLETIHATRNQGPPMKLREDFCGTALLCSDWVLSHEKRMAVGVDNDRSTLDWGIKRNIEPLGEEAARVKLLEQDVRSCTGEGFDVVAALNFSYCVFHDRKDLVDYFKEARRCLGEGGFFLLDLHGGPDAQFTLEEPKDMKDFEYVWDQDSFDPINNRTVCHIHFHFRDGTKMKKAFTYDWRHWSLPELRDAMVDAGFSTVETWWDDVDDVVRPKDSAVNTEAWVAFLVGWK